MHFEIKKETNVQCKLTITNTAEEVKNALEVAYQDAAKKLRLPGFRKGRAPLELVKQHLGTSAEKKAKEELLQKNLDDCASKLEPPPIHMPHFFFKQFNPKKGAVLIGIYETHPFVELADYSKLSVIEHIPIVDNDSVQEILENLRSEKATLIPREPSETIPTPCQQGDYVKINLILKEGSSVLLEKEDVTLILGKEQAIPGLDFRIMNMKIGGNEEFPLDIPSDFHEKDYAGKKIVASVTLLSCHYPEYPEMNDEFVRSMGVFQSLNEMKENIKVQIEEKTKASMREKNTVDMIQSIVAKSKLEIPETMLANAFENQLKRLQNQVGRDSSIEEFAQMIGETKEEFEAKLKEKCKRELSQEVVISSLSREMEVQLEESEVEKHMTNLYGAEKAHEMLHSLEEKPEMKDQLMMGMIREKTLDILYGKATATQGKHMTLQEIKEKKLILE